MSRDADQEQLERDAANWRKLIERVGGNDQWDHPMYIETHYRMLFSHPGTKPKDRWGVVIDADDLQEWDVYDVWDNNTNMPRKIYATYHAKDWHYYHLSKDIEVRLCTREGELVDGAHPRHQGGVTR